MKATAKQCRYALILLGKAGFSTSWMNAQYKEFATMRERSGRVEDWLRSMNVARISELIDVLRRRTEAAE